MGVFLHLEPTLSHFLSQTFSSVLSSAYGVTSHSHVCSVSVSWWDLTGLLWWNGKRLRLSLVLCWSLLWRRCQWWPDLTGVLQPPGANISGISEFFKTAVRLKFRKSQTTKCPSTELFKVFWGDQMEVCVTKIWRWTPVFCINHAHLVQRHVRPIKPLFMRILKCQILSTFQEKNNYTLKIGLDYFSLSP